MGTMKLLMVSGGGGGSDNSCGNGGGGGGGVLYNANYPIRSNSYVVIIGAGGAIDTAGENTVFGAELVQGGAAANTAAATYGGGGGGTNGTAGGAGKAGGAYGYAGGASNAVGGGGGGGAGGVGGNSNSDAGGSGGVGYSCDITGTSLIYGEGGGGGYGGSTTGVGGHGATGAGVVGSGMANRGGGGGGSYNAYGAGTGGSGVVIISYVTADWGACTGGTITTNGIYTVHTFTSNGTFTVVHKIKKLAGVAPLGAISLDTTSYQYNGATNSNNVTFSHTIGNGSDRLLVVYVPISQDITVSSVTYGGNACTLSIGKTNGQVKAYIYYMINPPVGSANVVVTFNTTIQYLIASAASFFGVNQTIPLTNTSSAAATAQNRSLYFYVPYGGCWILECIGQGTYVCTAASGQTTITGDNRVSSYDSSVSLGSNTQSWNCSGSVGYAWVGVSVVPVRTHFNKVAGIDGHLVKKVAGISNV